MNPQARLEQEERTLEPPSSPTLITFAVVMLMSASTTLSILSGDYSYSSQEGLEKEVSPLEKVSPSKDVPESDVTPSPSAKVAPSTDVAESDVSTPPLSTAVTEPEKITDTALLNSLEQQLFDSLDQTWTIPVTETSIYVVRVDETGAIIAYTPINSIAQDNLENTPLPQFIEPDNLKDSENTTVKFAEFEVIFSYTGRLEVQTRNPPENFNF
ncbi:hypothetical protein ACL6C3_00275 [Capilliphycus salinus ALCB114379]|uniref:hypothetical protein n=1 Tax=Capilliphycus salinus TaxID=2768948 RepID=UPI0039A6A877